jgi:hypothetical protein
MSQTTVIKENSGSENEVNSEISIVDILSEIQAIPQEYWPNLLQIIHSFRTAITSISVTINAPNKQEDQAKKNQKAIELLRLWRDTEDTLDQEEIWEILRQALEVNQ